MTLGSEVTRDEVAQWLKEYDGEPDGLRAYLEAKVEEPMIDTKLRDGYEDETHVVDLILEDLESYAT